MLLGLSSAPGQFNTDNSNVLRVRRVIGSVYIPGSSSITA